MVGAQKFADLIKERTNGRIEIKIYPANQLGKGEREMTEGIQQGAIDLLVTSTGPLGGFSPSINILDFPFLFRDFNHVDLVMDGPIGRKLLDDFEKANIKALAFWENGFRHLTNSKRPVIKVEDGKGLKIRTMENKVHLAAWKDAGLNPTPMAWGEVFTALQQGVIDGQENPIAVYYSSKLWDAGQKNFSLTAHVYSPSPFLMSKKTFDAMPKEDQELFLKTAYGSGQVPAQDQPRCRRGQAEGHGRQEGSPWCATWTAKASRRPWRRSMINSAASSPRLKSKPS